LPFFNSISAISDVTTAKMSGKIKFLIGRTSNIHYAQAPIPPTPGTQTPEQHWLFNVHECSAGKQDAACAAVGTAMEVTTGSAALPIRLISSRRETFVVRGISVAGPASR
jgi:hypothetical protein